MKSNKSSRLLYASVIGFFVMSASFLLMPLGGIEPGPTPMRVLRGVLFWLGLAVGAISQIALSSSLKEIKRASKRPRKGVGVATFMSNRIAFIFDVLLILSIIAFTVSLFIQSALGYFNYIIWFLFLFSLCMHSIFNGKNYYYLQLDNKRSVER